MNGYSGEIMDISAAFIKSSINQMQQSRILSLLFNWVGRITKENLGIRHTCCLHNIILHRVQRFWPYTFEPGGFMHEGHTLFDIICSAILPPPLSLLL